ncbi:MAG: AmmeMemoRadiSam system protein B [Calditrichaeota bacterium]|nr:MAG: AmmeMemoRadiSam system protein B [Calditrichota bacterium]
MGAENRNRVVRSPGVAGFFYPADKLSLERDLSLLLENAPLETFPRPIRGMIVPHAGYGYSGGVAARGYRQILGQKYDVIILIAPAHRLFFSHPTVFPGDSFLTPLGEIPVDKQFVELLHRKHPEIQLSTKGFESDEHSLEVQLPFLQWVVENVKIVPIMMGDQSLQVINLLSNALIDVLKERNFLVIASSDLSHYYNDSQARAMDQVVMNHVTGFDPDALYKDIESRRCEMCGYGPSITAMKVAKALGAQEGKVLLYRNSGDVTGERHNVVGYLAAVFY